MDYAWDLVYGIVAAGEWVGVHATPILLVTLVGTLAHLYRTYGEMSTAIEAEDTLRELYTTARRDAAKYRVMFEGADADRRIAERGFREYRRAVTTLTAHPTTIVVDHPRKLAEQGEPIDLAASGTS